ncbi:MAG: ribonuclease P protein component, partial [Bradyrhizobiaceae bacterium]|nr:ribonuclease P protein component [Bradyrhizobiaceae bacterium]
MERLKRRADFLAAAGGAKSPASAFVLQARARGDQGPARVGFTVSKKV